MTKIEGNRGDATPQFLFTDKLGMYLSQISNQWGDIIEALVVAHNDMWLIVAQFVWVGKADFCTDEPQTSDESCV